MDLDIHSDVCHPPMDYLANLSNECSLLSNFSSSQLIFSTRGGIDMPSNLARNNDITSSLFLLPKVNTQLGDVISKIEDILQHMVDCIIDEKKELVLYLRSRKSPGNEVPDVTSGAIKCSTTMKAHTIRFPGKTAQEAWKFSMSKCESAYSAESCTAAFLRILELCHEALVTGVVITKRFLSSSTLMCSLCYPSFPE